VINFYVKQNDTKPPIEAQLLQDGSEVDLEGCTVRFNMGRKNLGTASIENESEGRVKYSWGATDLEKDGTFLAEFEVTFSDDSVETFSNTATLLIVVTPEIA